MENSLPGVSLLLSNRQAVTKDLTSTSNFSGSCVLTFQTLPQRSGWKGWDRMWRKSRDSFGMRFLGRCQMESPTVALFSLSHLPRHLDHFMRALEGGVKMSHDVDSL